MNSKRRKKEKVVWSEEDDNHLLWAVHSYLQNHEDITCADDIDWSEIALPNKNSEECRLRLFMMHQNGKYFATTDELATSQISIDPSNWEACQARVRRGNAPNFERVHLQRDTRDPREFVSTLAGARLDATIVGDSITTVNDSLIPVDIFGKGMEAADKAHLLPKAREDAMTWDYPACAVLGLSMSPVDTVVVRKAELGCYDHSSQPAVRYPGIRNLLCNIIRVSNQGALFDKSPHVIIFPICDLGFVKGWAGQAYDAIVLCNSASVARRIGMTATTLDETENATISEINKALGLASEVCQFLAHSVLQKTEEEVDAYQNASDRAAHTKFRSEKQIFIPQPISVLPLKPIFKISFAGRTETTGDQHPAPDPMLLAFKSCNNWCRKYTGFQMVAGSRPKDLDDDLSEEGRQNLNNYLAWETAEQKSRQHHEIMNVFGSEGSISVP